MPLSTAAVEMLLSEALGYLDREHRPDRALVAVERVLESDPSNAAAAVMASLCAYELGNADAACPMFDRAIAVLPHAATPRRHKASLLLEQGRGGEALGELLRAEALSPYDVETKLALGAAYVETGRAGLAAAAYREAALLDPRLAGLRRGLVQLYLEAGRFDEGVSYYEKYVSSDGRMAGGRLVAGGRFSGVADWCHAHGAPCRVVAPPQPDVIHPPHYLGDGPPEPLPVTRPQTYVAEIPDATVIGGETLVIAPTGEILWDLATRPGVERFDLAERVTKFARSGVALIDALAPVEEPVEAAIAMAGVSSSNYYHWLVEFVARIANLEAADLASDYAGMPLLVDRAVLSVPQLLRVLQVVAGPDRELIPLDHGVARRVRRLVIPSELASMPNNLRDGEDLLLDDYYVSSEAIRFLRRRLAPPGLSLEGPGRRRLYLAKNGGRTRLLNGAELGRVLEKLDIETVLPELLCFEDQVRLFAEAELVVSETGAALTNLIFCPPSTRVVVLMGDHWNATWFSQIAGVLGQPAVFVAGRVTRPHPKIYQAVYQVDPRKVELALASLQAVESAA